jgi:hypothetical protein
MILGTCYGMEGHKGKNGLVKDNIPRDVDVSYGDI